MLELVYFRNPIEECSAMTNKDLPSTMYLMRMDFRKDSRSKAPCTRNMFISDFEKYKSVMKTRDPLHMTA